MTLKYLFILVLLLLSGNILAQKEANNWTFGQNAGLTWNTTRSFPATRLFGGSGVSILSGLPTSFNSSINTVEGCFTLSDENGTLLFYSDGMTIWNRLNNPMQNGTGLVGNNSSAQSGIIIPYPNYPNRYISVSAGIGTGENPPPAPIAYSVVDMTLAGGLGAIVAGEKNIEFQGASGITQESVTSILHANGTDYWVVATGMGNPVYLNAWLITSSGPQVTNPVITQTPMSVTPHNSSGYIKFTADGKHFVWATDLDGPLGTALFGDFNSATGEFSNFKIIGLMDNPYGVEFSPSMEYLYIGGQKKLYVYELSSIQTSISPNTIPRQEFNVGIEANALQLGPDGRIYFTAFMDDYLYVITNPNDYDNLEICQLQYGFLSNGNLSMIGLPSFSASWFRYEPEIAAFNCAGNPSTISIEIDDVTGLTATLDWNFGDGNTIIGQPVTNGITEYSQTHTYANGGLYTVTVTPRRSNGTALEVVTVAANIVECSVKTNRMIRTDLLNSDTKNLTR